MQFQVLLEGFGRSRRRDDFVALQRGFAEHIHAFPVIGFGAVGIGGNAFVEGGIGLVHLAGIGEDGAVLK